MKNFIHPKEYCKSIIFVLVVGSLFTFGLSPYCTKIPRTKIPYCYDIQVNVSNDLREVFKKYRERNTCQNDSDCIISRPKSPSCSAFGCCGIRVAINKNIETDFLQEVNTINQRCDDPCEWRDGVVSMTQCACPQPLPVSTICSNGQCILMEVNDGSE